MQDLSDHPFSPENIAYESGEDSASDKAWSAWLKRAAFLIGVASLDGDEKEDGYSLDFAFESFERGETADWYASEVQRKLRLRASIDDMKARFAAGEFAGRK